MRDDFILLVEDSSDDQVLVTRSLMENSVPFPVAVARNGAEALGFLYGRGEYAHRRLSFLPALILLDLNLPKLDGFKLLELLRQEEKTRQVPVVVLTASASPQDEERCRRLGANDFVRKPADFAAFSRAIRQLCLNWLSVSRSED